MPWGLIVLAVCSWLVFRRARNAGKNPFLWILALLGAVLVGCAIGLLVGSILREVGLAEEAIPLSGACGILLGLVFVIRAVGRA